eukprot:scaffold3852_cov402-Prasinococcus_capsulatus_cf.AAC.15
MHCHQELRAMLEVKALLGESAMQRRFVQLANGARETAMALQTRQSTFPGAITIVYGIIVLLLFVGGSYLVSTCAFTGGKLVGYLTSLVLLIEPLQALSTTVNELRDGESSMKRLLELKCADPQKSGFGSATEAGQSSARRSETNEEELRLESGVGLSFCLSSVSFAYAQQRKPVLDKVDMTVDAGKKVMLIGTSGGGKSTVLKLLLRLYEPSHGAIHMNGQVLAHPA